VSASGNLVNWEPLGKEQLDVAIDGPSDLGYNCVRRRVPFQFPLLRCSFSDPESKTVTYPLSCFLEPFFFLSLTLRCHLTDPRGLACVQPSTAVILRACSSRNL